jgi:thiol-disulfide isomerase/thioredoxin
MKFNLDKTQNYCFLLLLCFFLSCKKNIEVGENTAKSVLEEVKDYKKNPIIVIGITDDPKAFNVLYWGNGSYLFAKNHFEYTKTIIKDSLYLKLDSIKVPQVMRFTTYGDSAKYKQRFFVTPGDSILLIIKNKKLQVISKNQAHYNFYKELGSLNLVAINYNGNLNEYKKECKDIYDKQITFFNTYINENKNVSKEFEIKIKANLKFNYFSKIMFIYKKNATRGKTVMEILREDTYLDKEAIFDVNSYFDGLAIDDIKRPELLSNMSFKTFFSSYVREFLVNPNLENYSNEKFEAEKEFILSNFSGELQHFAIVKLINDYNYFGQSENYYNLKNLIKEYKHNFSKPSYLETIVAIETELNYVKNPFNKASLNSKLLNLNGDTLLLKDILKLSKNNIKSIDFWASWCTPCINEIIIGDTNRKEISENNNVQWFYFSMDKNKDEWIKKSKELSAYGLMNNQYLILDLKNSELRKFLNVSSIPRYVILDRKDRIVNANAPRPSFENKFEKIINGIDSK